MFRTLLKRIFDNTPEQDKPKPEISEPVYKMVEVFKKNPSRFKYKELGYEVGFFSCSIKDIYLNETFVITMDGCYLDPFHNNYFHINHDITFTQDENIYLYNEISPYVYKRVRRLKSIWSYTRKKITDAENEKQKQLRNELYKKLSETG